MRQHDDPQRGATIIEAAIVLPLLILLVVSVMELGVAFKDYLTVDFAAKEGARVGALAGNDINADCAIVQSIVAGYGVNDFDSLDSITIFQVSESGTPLPNRSNVWVFPNNTSDDPNDCDDWTVGPHGWDSTTRDVSLAGSADLDIVGITIDTTHGWITGFPPWRGGMDISRTAIQRLEPEAFE